MFKISRHQRSAFSLMLMSGFLLAVLALPAAAQRKEKEKEKSKEPAPLAGCEDEVKSGKEKGKQERFFPYPVAKVKEAAKGALAALEFEVKKDTDKGMEANKRRHIGVFVGSGGEKVVLHFAEAEENGQKGTRVSGETKKGFVGRVGQKSWTNAVMAQTACQLRSAT